MANIRPFQCLRPNDEIANKFAALPYDVYNREEARLEVMNNPQSFLKIDRAETTLAADVDIYSDEVYAQAKKLFDEAVSDKTLFLDKDRSFYIYELTMDNRTQTGIVATASIDDYLANVIKKHENTRQDKQLDRIKHVDSLSAQTGPIFLAYRSNDIINREVNRAKKECPIYSFTSDDKIRHQVWKISNKESVRIIENEFAKIDSIYIADGHHRAASAVSVGLKRREENPSYNGDEKFNFFLSVLFPDEELMILDYNRVVRDLNGLSSDEFLQKIEEQGFIISPCESAKRPDKKGTFGMYLDNKWYILTAKDSIKSSDVVDGLDVSILQNNILGPILNITDPKTDKRIDFVGGIRGIKELERKCSKDFCLAFLMYPTSINELFMVADANKLMPPKSTWFEPKLRSGLFIHKI
ncbi:DUF1015 domain-containing protein [Lachnospira multipara]|uniref:DUF1015 domain-containing protein n=1 Tax=Lachnospira multipara TaxID=28051 RepID=UPI0004E0E5A2|nr:DUF1015 family protein [Lachnospira multipara]